MRTRNEKIEIMENRVAFKWMKHIYELKAKRKRKTRIKAQTKKRFDYRFGSVQNDREEKQMSKKVAYACSHTGFVISEKGKSVLAKAGFSTEEIEDIEKNHKHRDDPRLISCIEKLGSSFNGTVYGWAADICIAEIPDGYSPIFSRYDGLEAVTGFPGHDILRK
jgi:hypothetical protein